MVEAAHKAVEALSSCLCCLVNKQAKYLKAAYVHEGKTEIYIDMLKDCLDIRIDIDSNACGICEECVGRLRDATNFKLQVQRCQVKLHKLVTKAVRLLEEEEPEVKLEVADDDNQSINQSINGGNMGLGQEEESEVKTEIANDDDDVSDNLSIRQDADPPAETTDRDGASEDSVTRDEDDVKPETVDAAGTGGDSTGSACVLAESARSVRARAREQLAMTCVVRLERLSQSQCRASHEAVTTDHEASLTTHVKDMRHDSLGVRAEAEGGADTASGRGAGHCCGTCGKKFPSKSQLIIHTVVHTGEKPFSCDICNKRFTRKEHLARHINIHTEENTYSCDICYKRFNNKNNLIRHITIHTGQKPYRCDVCNKRYTTKQNLTTHIRLHTGQRPYSCDICMKRFNGKNDLKRHIRIHTEKKPDICNKLFIATQIKPYICAVCSKRFSRKDVLTKHTKTHTRPKPYCCDVCHQQFAFKIRLKRHLRASNHKKARRRRRRPRTAPERLVAVQNTSAHNYTGTSVIRM